MDTATMVDVIEQPAANHAAFEADFQRLLGRLGSGWGFFAAGRSEALARFIDVGFPTTSHEEWRFTNVAPIARGGFQLAEPHAVKVQPGHLSDLSFGQATGTRLTFVDGQFRPDLSAMSGLPTGITVSSLSAAVAAGNVVVRQHLGRYADLADPFTALNTAFIEEGAFVHIPAGTVVEAPIHLLLITSAAAGRTVTHPRHLIVAEASATVVEHYVALDNTTVCWSNAVTEAYVGKNAELHHYLLERDSLAGFAIQTLRVEQERDSRFESHTVLLGGQIVRNNIHVELVGENCNSTVNGLYLPTGTQHHDNHMRVVHAAPHCDSRQFYKGILKDKAHGVFSGRIVVRPGAQKTDAKQTNRNLLLSDDAVIDTKPQLEIYADDVKCTHGATTGRIDEAALFYLMARGISRVDAQGLLIYAFAHESLERMTVLPVRAALEKLLIEKLPQTSMMTPLV
jgi:Fe-S cluster assembly protein SufD